MIRWRWPDRMTRSGVVVALVGGLVFVAAYGLLVLLRLFLPSLLDYELRHFAFLDACGLTFVVAPSFYWLTVRKLRMNKALLELAMGAMLDALIITDTQGRVIEWSSAAERMFQYTRAESLGKSLSELIGTDARFSPRWRGTGKLGLPTQDGHESPLAEVTARRRDGNEITVEMSTVVARWHGGSHAIHILRDVSERRSFQRGLEESELQLRLATEMADIAVWHYDFASNQMFRTRNHDQLYGMPWQHRWDIDTFMQVTHPEDRERSAAIIQASVVPGGPDAYSFDFRVITPGGNQRWLWARGRVTERDSLLNANQLDTKRQACWTRTPGRLDGSARPAGHGRQPGRRRQPDHPASAGRFLSFALRIDSPFRGSLTLL